MTTDLTRVERALKFLDEWERREALTARERVAYHEAGHAVMARLSGSEVYDVSIVGDPAMQSLGRCRRSRLTLAPVVGSRVTSADRHLVDGELLIVAAGPLAERIKGFADDGTGAAEIQIGGNVLLFLESEMGDSERRAYIAWILARAEAQLRANWPWVERVAQALLADRQIDGPQFNHLSPPSALLPPIIRNNNSRGMPE